MNCHITGFFWVLDKKATPLLQVVEDNGITKYIPLYRNKEIQIIQDFGKKCIGYFCNREHHICENENNIEKGRQCKECKSKDEYLVCARCNGTKCSADSETMKNCLNKTHFMYITLIGDQIKVGITRAGRYFRAD